MQSLHKFCALRNWVYWRHSKDLEQKELEELAAETKAPQRLLQKFRRRDFFGRFTPRAPVYNPSLHLF
jgi:hypothetical protein